MLPIHAVSLVVNVLSAAVWNRTVSARAGTSNTACLPRVLSSHTAEHVLACDLIQSAFGVGHVERDRYEGTSMHPWNNACTRTQETTLPCPLPGPIRCGSASSPPWHARSLYLTTRPPSTTATRLPFTLRSRPIRRGPMAAGAASAYHLHPLHRRLLRGHQLHHRDHRRRLRRHRSPLARTTSSRRQ